MGHDRRATVARFAVAAQMAVGGTVTLDAEQANHIRVLRLKVGSRVGVANGIGTLASGELRQIGRSSAVVDVDEVWTVPRPMGIHMLVPVADRDRMLLLAEKCTELQATSWQPVQWRRSASVSPRGTGSAFEARLVARMRSALTQCGGAWLPEVRPAMSLGDALASLPATERFVLDRGGEPLARLFTPALSEIGVAVGPEGGIEPDEHRTLDDAGFVRASIGDSILRFETAGIAALAVLRAMAASRGRPPALGAPSQHADSAEFADDL